MGTSKWTLVCGLYLTSNELFTLPNWYSGILGQHLLFMVDMEYSLSWILLTLNSAMRVRQAFISSYIWGMGSHRCATALRAICDSCLLGTTTTTTTTKKNEKRLVVLFSVYWVHSECVRGISLGGCESVCVMFVQLVSAFAASYVVVIALNH